MPACFSSASTDPTSTWWSTSGRPSRWSRRTRCGRLARRSGPRPSSPTTSGSSTRRSDRFIARAAGAPPAPRRRIAWPRRSSTPSATGARALVGFPLPVPAPDRVPDLLARLVARGFARIRVGTSVVPLSPLPELDLARPGDHRGRARPARPAAGRPDAAGRLVRAGLPRGRRPGGGGSSCGTGARPRSAATASGSAARPAGRRSSVRSPSCSHSTTRSAPAPTARASAISCATTWRAWCRTRVSRSPAARSSPGATRRAGESLQKGAAPGGPAPEDRRPPALPGAPGDRCGSGSTRATTGSAASGGSSKRSRGTATSSTSACSFRATGARFPARRARGTRLKPDALAVTVAGRSDCRGGAPPQSTTWPPGSRALPLTLWEAEVAREVLGPTLGQGLVPPSGRPRLPRDRRARRAPCPAARRSGSGSPPSSGPSSSARSTCSTSRRSGSTRATWAAGRSVPGLAHAGNTVVVVEHDRSYRSRRHCVELGPGRVSAAARWSSPGREEFVRDIRSLTGATSRAARSFPAVGRREGTATSSRWSARRRITSRASRPAYRSRPHVRHGRLRLRQVHPGPRHALPGGRPRVQDGVRAAGRPRGARRARDLTASGDRPGADRADPPLDPVTYVKAFDDIRSLFAGLPRAKTLGLTRGTSRSTCPGAGARRARATASRSSRCTSSRTST